MACKRGGVFRYSAFLLVVIFFAPELVILLVFSFLQVLSRQRSTCSFSFWVCFVLYRWIYRWTLFLDIYPQKLHVLNHLFSAKLRFNLCRMSKQTHMFFWDANITRCRWTRAQNGPTHYLGGVLVPTFVPKSKTDKIQNSHIFRAGVLVLTSFMIICPKLVKYQNPNDIHLLVTNFCISRVHHRCNMVLIVGTVGTIKMLKTIFLMWTLYFLLTVGVAKIVCFCLQFT